MTVDRKARTDLQIALVRYMTGQIRAFEFDDRNTLVGSEQVTTDSSLHQISRRLWYFHDDVVDHSISVTEQGWATLQRIVVFLQTDLEIEAAPKECAWPFQSPDDWNRHASLLEGMNLPEYNAEIHGCQVHPWWNRIPSRVGFAIIGGLVVAVLLLLLVL